MRTNLAGTKILVGIDFSECSERALLRAITRAEEEHAQLELLHVFEWNGAAAPDQASHPPDAERSRLWREVTAQAQSSQRRLAQLCAAFVGDRVPARIRVLIGDPALCLLKTAEQSAASLIVLGAIGRRTLPRGTVGTTAELVCEKSAVPVVLIPYVERQKKKQGRMLFLSARDQLLWSCVRCGTVQRSGDSERGCTICGDPSPTWVSMQPPQVAFSAVQ